MADVDDDHSLGATEDGDTTDWLAICKRAPAAPPGSFGFSSWIGSAVSQQEADHTVVSQPTDNPNKNE